MCLSQTLPWRSAAEHPLTAVTFNLINGGKVYRRIAVTMPIDQSHVMACFFQFRVERQEVGAEGFVCVFHG